MIPHKRYINFFFVFLLFFILLGAKNEKRLKEPPGTLRLHDSLYVDQYPVSTRDYRSFLGALKTYYCEEFHDSVQKLPLWGNTRAKIDSIKMYYDGDSLLFEKMLPRMWMTYDNYRKKYEVDYHLTNPRFIDHPVVNIREEHIKMFCKWRTDMIKIYYSVISKNEKVRNKYPLNFKFRIIKKDEWEQILSDNFLDVGKADKKRSLENMNIPKPYKRKRGRKFYYDVDNAAELLDDNVVAVDFQWTQSVKMGNISYMNFNEPAAYISFRCVCEVLPLPPEPKKKKKD